MNDSHYSQVPQISPSLIQEKAITPASFQMTPVKSPAPSLSETQRSLPSCFSKEAWAGLDSFSVLANKSLEQGPVPHELSSSCQLLLGFEQLWEQFTAGEKRSPLPGEPVIDSADALYRILSDNGLREIAGDIVRV